MVMKCLVWLNLLNWRKLIFSNVFVLNTALHCTVTVHDNIYSISKSLIRPHNKSDYTVLLYDLGSVGRANLQAWHFFNCCSCYKSCLFRGQQIRDEKRVSPSMRWESSAKRKSFGHQVPHWALILFTIPKKAGHISNGNPGEIALFRWND